MNRIVASVTTLLQHVEAVKQTPEIYRPLSCPHCGIKIVWQHGYYTRKADRRQQGEDSLNPVPILRFCCSACRRTCSRLPLCIAPRRWYDWSAQQGALDGLLNGDSLRGCARAEVRDRRTVGRWWNWLQERGQTFESHLRARLPELGRIAGFVDFWRHVFKSMGLAAAMALLDWELIVP
jgi:DNA-directed RNA polymerase subunit N (RpoN/RPB10)